MESAHRTVGRIHPLSAQLANQIAAGEVVERPASVLKELLENSLDAGADRIEVEVEQGGVALLRVRDNGSGMPGEDLPLALSRHATSKIHDSEDLLHIHSLGFRGEALASIGAIARVQLVSATPGGAHGWVMTCEAGVASTTSPAPHPPGTTVEVRDLFFNTPARRKFLRADKTEFGHIDDVVRRIALSRFDVALTLQHNARRVHHLAPAVDAAGRVRRVARLFGQAFLAQSVYLEDEASGLRLSGWLARPTFSRSQADLQYFYVNGRMMRDRVISHAVRQAYQDALYPGRHPAYVLHLELDPGQVDVNVHPTKHEVRFRETRQVHDFLYRSLRHALGASGTVAPVPRPVGQGGAETLAGASRAGGASMGVAEALAGYHALHGPIAHGSAPVAPIADQGTTSLGRVDRFVLAERETGPVVVDLDAVRLSETLARLQAAWCGGAALRSRPLLVPRTVAVGTGEVDALDAMQDRLAQVGLELTRSGTQGLLLRAVPILLADADIAGLAQGLSVLLQDSPGDDAAWLACLARHGTDVPVARLAQTEVTRLLAQAWTQAVTGRDVQGRQLWTPLTALGLAALFDQDE